MAVRIVVRGECCYYIRQRSWANVMYSSPFVCLSVSRITQKVMDGFVGRMLCIHPRLFVCLLAGLLKKLWTDLNEI